MPFKYKCRNCGEILYEDELLKSPEDLIKLKEGQCPRCKQYLYFSADRVDIKPRTTPYVEKHTGRPPGKDAKKRGNPKP